MPLGSSETKGSALIIIRKIEQGKENLNLEKVNRLLKMCGHTLASVNARKAAICYKHIWIGTPTETEDGEYVFQYDEGHINFPE